MSHQENCSQTMYRDTNITNALPNGMRMRLAQPGDDKRVRELILHELVITIGWRILRHTYQGTEWYMIKLLTVVGMLFMLQLGHSMLTALCVTLSVGLCFVLISYTRRAFVYFPEVYSGKISE